VYVYEVWLRVLHISTNMNQRQWKDIKYRYMETEEE
jgi:hypothetical protein